VLFRDQEQEHYPFYKPKAFEFDRKLSSNNE